MQSQVGRGGGGDTLRLTWKRLGESDSEFVSSTRRGAATLIGDCVYFSSYTQRLWVLSLRNYTWKLVGKVLTGIEGGHVSLLAADKIYFFGPGSKGVVEYDTVLATARIVTRIDEGSAGYLWVSAAFAPWRNEIISFGGYNRRIRRMNETHAFNVVTNTWKKLDMRGKLPEPRTAAAATIRGTKLYVYGGYGNAGPSFGELWIAELSGFVPPFWTLAQANSQSAIGCTMPTLSYLNGFLIVYGGHVEENKRLQMYSLQEGEWYRPEVVELKDAPSKFEGHLAITVSTGILYFAKDGKDRDGTATLMGNEVYYSTIGGLLSVFSLKTLRWRFLGKELFQLAKGQAAELAFDKIYYFGGKVDHVIEYDVVLARAGALNPDTERPGGKTWISASFAPWRDEIITFGGYDRNLSYTNETCALNVLSKTWKKLKMRGKPPQPRAAHVDTIYGRKMYVYGGYGEIGQSLGDIWIADLRSAIAPFWSLAKTNGDSPVSCLMPSLNSFTGCFVIFGEDSSRSNVLQIYFPKEGSWHHQSSSKVAVEGDPLIATSYHLGVTLSLGILYFCRSGVYLLSKERL